MRNRRKWLIAALILCSALATLVSFSSAPIRSVELPDGSVLRFHGAAFGTNIYYADGQMVGASQGRSSDPSKSKPYLTLSFSSTNGWQPDQLILTIESKDEDDPNIWNLFAEIPFKNPIPKDQRE